MSQELSRVIEEEVEENDVRMVDVLAALLERVASERGEEPLDILEETIHVITSSD